MKKLVFRGLAAWLLVALCSAAAWARPAVLIPGGQTVGIKLYSQGLVVTGFDQKSAAKAAGFSLLLFFVAGQGRALRLDRNCRGRRPR